MNKTVSIIAAAVSLAACAFTLSAQPAGAPPAGGMPGGAPKSVDTSFVKTKYLDIAYASLSKTQTLDIYLPNSGSGPFPVLFCIHGGGFAFGDARGAELGIALKALDRGIAVVGVNYRMSGEAAYPAAINDVKAAIRYVRANAATWKLDPARFAAFGSSAGGHLAALVGTSGDEAVFKDAKLGNVSVSDKVQAVAEWYGPIDFTAMDAQFAASGIKGQTHSSADSFESKYMGALITSIPEKIKETNPETWIDAKDPPFMIAHGTADPNIPTQQSVGFANKLFAALGADKVSLAIIPGAVHGGAAFETDTNMKAMLDFLAKNLK